MNEWMSEWESEWINYIYIYINIPILNTLPALAPFLDDCPAWTRAEVAEEEDNVVLTNNLQREREGMRENESECVCVYERERERVDI